MLQAPRTCPSRYSLDRLASTKRTPARNRRSASSVEISVQGCSGAAPEPEAEALEALDAPEGAGAPERDEDAADEAPDVATGAREIVAAPTSERSHSRRRSGPARAFETTAARTAAATIAKAWRRTVRPRRCTQVSIARDRFEFPCGTAAPSRSRRLTRSSWGGRVRDAGTLARAPRSWRSGPPRGGAGARRPSPSCPRERAGDWRGPGDSARDSRRRTGRRGRPRSDAGSGAARRDPRSTATPRGNRARRAETD